MGLTTDWFTVHRQLGVEEEGKGGEGVYRIDAVQLTNLSAQAEPASHIVPKPKRGRTNIHAPIAVSKQCLGGECVYI